MCLPCPTGSLDSGGKRAPVGSKTACGVAQGRMVSCAVYTILSSTSQHLSVYYCPVVDIYHIRRTNSMTNHLQFRTLLWIIDRMLSTSSSFSSSPSRLTSDGEFMLDPSRNTLQRVILPWIRIPPPLPSGYPMTSTACIECSFSLGGR